VDFYSRDSLLKQLIAPFSRTGEYIKINIPLAAKVALYSVGIARSPLGTNLSGSAEKSRREIRSTTDTIVRNSIYTGLGSLIWLRDCIFRICVHCALQNESICPFSI